MAAFFLVMKITTAYLRLIIVAYSQPHLRLISFLQIIGCTSSSHLCRNPTGINCIGVNLGPPPRYCLAKHQNVQLRIGVSDAADISFETFQFWASLQMHAGAQVDQSFWFLYEARKNIRCECVDREDLFWQSLINTRVVNNRVELA